MCNNIQISILQFRVYLWGHYTKSPISSYRKRTPNGYRKSKMSTRHMRKVCGGNELPPPEEDSDYEPLYVGHTSNSFKYAGLVSNSDSSSKEDVDKDDDLESTPPQIVKKQKKKKQKKHTQHKKNSDEAELDEIDQSVKEVNELMGNIPIKIIEEKPQFPAKSLLSVENVHLNVANEKKRLFGPEENEGKRRRGRQADINRMLKRGLIVQPDDYLQTFTRVGLTMSIDRLENGITYFVFNHDKEYQRTHRRFLETSMRSRMIIPIDEALQTMHVEQLIECTDMLFRLEEYSTAQTLIERSIAYLQFVSHPSFRLSDSSIRLEYKIRENRTFYVAVLKYLHMLTNSACHRTALELAKLLFNLDPTDPLAILFIIDILALRARKHQWLIDAIDHWKTERDADYLFNLQYSYAMSHFHVTRKSGDTSHADMLLQKAIKNFPTVALRLIEFTNLKNVYDRSHPFYKEAEQMTPAKLKDLIYIHAKLAESKWREPEVLAWFTKNVKELVEKYDNDRELRLTVSELAVQRLEMFRTVPDEIMRHLSVISSMSNLLIDQELPCEIKQGLCAADPKPWPDNNINRYKYPMSPPDQPVWLSSSGGLFNRFFMSMAPNFQLPGGENAEIIHVDQNNAIPQAQAAVEGQRNEAAANGQLEELRYAYNRLREAVPRVPLVPLALSDTEEEENED